MDHLAYALGNLDYATTTNDPIHIESSTALVTSFVRSGLLEATESSHLDLRTSLGLMHRLKIAIPHSMEVLEYLSWKLSKVDLQDELQELHAQRLLSFDCHSSQNFYLSYEKLYMRSMD